MSIPIISLGSGCSPDWKAEAERLTRALNLRTSEREAIRTDLIAMTKERNALKAEVEHRTALRSCNAERGSRPIMRPSAVSSANSASRSCTRVHKSIRANPMPVCKCGAPADPTFHSPVSGARCTNCAYRMVGKVPPGERFYRGEDVAPVWKFFGFAVLIVGTPIAIGTLIANHAEIAHLANLLWGLVP